MDILFGSFVVDCAVNNLLLRSLQRGIILTMLYVSPDRAVLADDDLVVVDDMTTPMMIRYHHYCYFLYHPDQVRR